MTTQSPYWRLLNQLGRLQSIWCESRPQQVSSCLEMDRQNPCEVLPMASMAISMAAVGQLEVLTVALDNDNTAVRTFQCLHRYQATKRTYELTTSSWSYQGVLHEVAVIPHFFLVVGQQRELPTSHSLDTRRVRSSWHCTLRATCHSFAASLVRQIAGLLTRQDLFWSRFGCVGQ